MAYHLNYGKKHFTQQRHNMSARVFNLTGNFTVCSTACAQSMKENNKALYALLIPCGGTHRWSMESPHKGPAMRKAFIMQLQDYMFTCVSSTEKQSTHNSDNTWATWDFIWLATLLFVQQCTPENETKILKFRTNDPLWGEPTDNQWTRHTKGQQYQNNKSSNPKLQFYICSSILCKKHVFRWSLGMHYRKVSNTRRAKCQNLNDSRLVLQSSVPNPLKPSVKSIMKM